MLPKIIAVALLLSGCAETRWYEDGQLVCEIQGDATNLTIRTYRGGYFHADSLNHSLATKTVGDNIAKTVGSLGSTAMGVAGVLK